jgi:DNA-binding NarL/FixJ family response regulator
MARHRVLLVEDDPRTRARLEGVIAADPSLELAGSAGTLDEGRRGLATLAPDVLITDLGLPDGDGTELIRLAAEKPACLCMVITVFGDETHVLAAIEAGAMGYLLKDAAPESITASILEMVGGGSPISPPIARTLLRRFRSEEPPPEPQPELPRLSGREQEVLKLVVKGFSTPEIARLLQVSPHTVTTHVRGIYRKLAVSSRGEAVYEALQLGLVRLDE